MNLLRLSNRLKSDEGVRYEVYLDHLGFKTFGVGHKITEGDPEYQLPVGAPVPMSVVYEVFQKDLREAIADARDVYFDVWDELPEEVQEILVNMVFNLGRRGLSKFYRMNFHIRNRDWKAAALEGRDSLWHKQVPNRAERLMVELENIG